MQFEYYCGGGVVLKRIRSMFGNDEIATESGTVSIDDASARKPTPIDVTDADFGRLVLEADRLVALDFWADWCQPCRVMSAQLDMLAQECGDSVLFAALDVEENPITSEQYGIQGLPTVIFLRNGDEVYRQVGVTAFDALRMKVEELTAVG